MISTRWRHCAPVVTALIVTIAAAGVRRLASARRDGDKCGAGPRRHRDPIDRRLGPRRHPCSHCSARHAGRHDNGGTIDAVDDGSAPGCRRRGAEQHARSAHRRRVGAGRRDLQDRLLGAGDFAFGVAVSIDGVPVHAASFGDRNSPNIVLPPPEPPTDSAGCVDDRNHDDDRRPPRSPWSSSRST